MADRVTKVCNRCGKEIKSNPVLGDLQGGPVEIRFPAFTGTGDLDEECMDELFELFGRFLDRDPTKGAAVGLDQLAYLPVLD